MSRFYTVKELKAKGFTFDTNTPHAFVKTKRDDGYTDISSCMLTARRRATKYLNREINDVGYSAKDGLLTVKELKGRGYKFDRIKHGRYSCALLDDSGKVLHWCTAASTLVLRRYATRYLRLQQLKNGKPTQIAEAAQR